MNIHKRISKHNKFCNDNQWHWGLKWRFMTVILLRRPVSFTLDNQSLLVSTIRYKNNFEKYIKDHLFCTFHLSNNLLLTFEEQCTAYINVIDSNCIFKIK